MTAWTVVGPADRYDRVDLYLGSPQVKDVHVIADVLRRDAEILVSEHARQLREATKRGAMPPPAVEAMLVRVLTAALRELGWGLVPPTIRRRVRRPASEKENNRVP